MYVSPHDYVSHQIYFFGSYDPLMTNWLKAHVHEGDGCWDVGAERGWFSLLMGDLVGPTGRVDSFEANPETFAKLKANITRNRFDWVRAHNTAVLAKVGEARFEVPTQDSGAGHVVQSTSKDGMAVPATTLDEMVERTGITKLNFIKIDIEGSETAALTGGQRAIERFRPKLLIEYNRSALRRAGSSVEELDHMLEELNYERYTFNGKLRRVDLDSWQRLPDEQYVFNVYCLYRNDSARP
ncbi:MAG: FkbM family methyltransferase [Caldilineaceae bacterium]|nr:FkbM family methyltransferase [Caldilineaceae bacterium]